MSLKELDDLLERKQLGEEDKKPKSWTHYYIPIPTILWWLQVTWYIWAITLTIRTRYPTVYRDLARRALLCQGKPVTITGVEKELVGILGSHLVFRNLIPKYKIWTRNRFVTELANACHRHR